MAACLTLVGAWRELEKKEDNNDNKDSFQKTLVGHLFCSLFWTNSSVSLDLWLFSV